MIEILVIADDLTGAADTGIQFLDLCRNRMCLADLDMDIKGADFSGLSLNTETRNVPVDGVKAAMARVAHLALNLGPRMIYKKMDSSLRGYIGFELAELTRILPGIQGVLAAPALPGLGRTTVDGVHYVGGTPVSDSEAGKDPLSPVTDSRLAAILSQGHKLPVVSLDLSLIRRGAGAIAAELSRLIELHNPVIFAADAENEQDLNFLAQAGRVFGGRLIMAGSAGLAKAIGRQVPLASLLAEGKKPRRPLMLFGGSVSQKLREQMEFLAKSGLAHVLSPNIKMMMDDPGVMPLPAWPLGEDLALLLPPPSDEENKGGEFSWNLARAFGQVAARLVAEHKPATIFLSGGDTAKAILSALKVDKLWLRSEILPGVVLMETKDFFVITKAGSFGDRMLLIHLYGCL